MSTNYTSQPIKYQRDESQLDGELMSQVLQLKNQKYDMAEAKMNATLAQLGNFGIDHRGTKDRFSQEMNKMLQTLSKSNLRDLSNKNVEGAINKHINSLLTPEYLQHNAIHQANNKFEEEVDKKREEDPESFSMNNYQAAKINSGYYNYAQSGKLADFKNGQLRLKDNENVLEDSLDLLSKIKDIRGKYVYEQQDDAGNVVRIETDVLTEDYLRVVAPRLFTPSQVEQMTIDGAASLNFDQNRANSLWEEHKENLKGNLERTESSYKINLKEAESKVGVNSDAYKALDNNYKLLMADQKQQLASAEERPLSVNELGLQLTQRQMVADLTAMTANRPSQYITKLATVDKKESGRPKEEASYKEPIITYSSAPTNTEDIKFGIGSNNNVSDGLDENISNTLDNYTKLSSDLAEEIIVAKEIDKIKEKALFKENNPDIVAYGEDSVDEAYNLKVIEDHSNQVINGKAVKVRQYEVQKLKEEYDIMKDVRDKADRITSEFYSEELYKKAMKLQQQGKDSEYFKKRYLVPKTDPETGEITIENRSVKEELDRLTEGVRDQDEIKKIVKEFTKVGGEFASFTQMVEEGGMTDPVNFAAKQTLINSPTVYPLAGDNKVTEIISKIAAWGATKDVKALYSLGVSSERELVNLRTNAILQDTRLAGTRGSTVSLEKGTDIFKVAQHLMSGQVSDEGKPWQVSDQPVDIWYDPLNDTVQFFQIGSSGGSKDGLQENDFNFVAINRGVFTDKLSSLNKEQSGPRDTFMGIVENLTTTTRTGNIAYLGDVNKVIENPRYYTEKEAGVITSIVSSHPELEGVMGLAQKENSIKYLKAQFKKESTDIESFLNSDQLGRFMDNTASRFDVEFDNTIMQNGEPLAQVTLNDKISGSPLKTFTFNSNSAYSPKALEKATFYSPSFFFTYYLMEELAEIESITDPQTRKARMDKLKEKTNTPI